MSKSIITIANLNTGEVVETDVEIYEKRDQKFIIRGHKMYDKGVEDLIKALTKQEALTVIGWHKDTDIVGLNNIFKVNFRTLTMDMSRSSRSKFKRKLIDAGVLLEYGSYKRMLLNPYMFLPRIDKNIHNSQYLTQRAWNYLENDKDSYTEDVRAHIHHMFEE